ncbi:replication initiator protein [Sigmofec virus UA08Rod_4822]|uniref:Replication initiator protein n=1 Tax=Sigmofec virus UA08Rod_4822 TaxID=2929411 RepID=A0A976R5C1_9VIRU|nr:replication initiator protein [Sigmofec virus UA08Rod_4822]
MCVYPRLIDNPKYKPNRKNGYHAPYLHDKRVGKVPVPCGICYECRRQKSRAWRVRLTEAFKANSGCKFVTLTFSPEALEKFENQFEKEAYRAIVTKAVRMFLERWRKEEGVSVKHWLISELGHKGTERIHLHGLLWTQKTNAEIQAIWQYGLTFTGTYINHKTITYISKYITKADKQHPDFIGKILCSKGIGNEFTRNELAIRRNRYQGADTLDNYRLPQGSCIQMPQYYRYKLYTEDQREKLWIHKLDHRNRWVCGVEVRATDYQLIDRILKTCQRKNEELGYGKPSDDWKAPVYNREQKELREGLQTSRDQRKQSKERARHKAKIQWLKQYRQSLTVDKTVDNFY